ncbi:MAG: hypothetical protein FD137_1620 [Spirochaetes bacterium]|nr:MAG: hypothetical protein FD137_1620 [Spirochaetota bacterium]
MEIKTSVAESMPSERTERLPESEPATTFARESMALPARAIQLAFRIKADRVSVRPRFSVIGF